LGLRAQLVSERTTSHGVREVLAARPPILWRSHLSAGLFNALN